MNPDVLRYESEHVREEHRKLRELLEIEEMAIRLLARDLIEAAGEGRPVQLPLGGELEVIDSYIAAGAREVFRLAFEAETERAADAA